MFSNLRRIIRWIFISIIILLLVFISTFLFPTHSKIIIHVRSDDDKRNSLERLTSTYLWKNGPIDCDSNIILTLKNFYKNHNDEIYIKENGEEFTITVIGTSNIIVK